MPVLRTATAADADDIARLTIQLGYDVTRDTVAARLAGILARSDHRFIVADSGSRAVGWVHAQACEYVDVDPFVMICGLVVDDAERGKGIGRLLMGEAEQWARQHGYAVVRLTSSATRTAAHRFYESIGYTNIKTQFSFAKSIGAGAADLRRFVPRVKAP